MCIHSFLLVVFCLAGLLLDIQESFTGDENNIMNYRIINDREKLREFIEWLPDLLPEEKFYISLLGRNKYDGNLKKDKLQLKRFTADKLRLFGKIEQLEVPFGAYSYGNDNLPVPQDCLALYISPNPRSLVKATQATILELQKKSWAAYDGYNPHSICLSNIQSSNGTVKYFDFDFDGVSIEEAKSEIWRAVNLDACTFIQTYGGFHLLVDIKKVDNKFKKSWNPQITKIKGCDVRGTSGMIPVPGCSQGNFCPILVKL